MNTAADTLACLGEGTFITLGVVHFFQPHAKWLPPDAFIRIAAIATLIRNDKR